MSDSASDAEADPSSDSEPHNEHSSADVTDDGDLTELETDDQAVADTSSYTGKLLTYWKGIPIDSAQLTVFDCAPPFILCKPVPKLKLFHELSSAEQKAFKKLDKIKPSCSFCRKHVSIKSKEKSAGASALHDHFKNTGTSYECTWPGCTESFARFDSLLKHYGFAHEPFLSRLKCDTCNFVANSTNSLEDHYKHPHPADELAALNTYSKNTHNMLVRWKKPEYCSKCDKWYPEFLWKKHTQHHAGEKRTFDSTLPVQGVQIQGLRADSKCPFDGCNELYRDFVGWYLHCTMIHSECIASGFVPRALNSDVRARLPTFRCTTCYASIPIGQVQNHRAQCTARVLPETVGPLLLQRAAAYDEEPGLLKLENGVHVKERRFMSVLQEATDLAADAQRVEGSLRAIRGDPFLHSFVGRNRSAPESHALYVVAKIRRGTVPGLSEWLKKGIIYAGSSKHIATRVAYHVQNTTSCWFDMGLTLEEDEELYLFRMTITIDEKTSTASFTEPDLRRLEQVLVDSLGIGTLYNNERVLACETMLNDITYRNHIAPRLNQLALILFESTHTKLIKNKDRIIADDKNVWKLVITRPRLNNVIRQAPVAGLAAGTDSAKSSDATKQTTRADQALIPAPRILSPEVHDVLTRYRDELGLTEEELFDRLRARRASARTSCTIDLSESEKPLRPSGASGQSGLPDQPTSTSPDLFADDYPYYAEDDLDIVPTTSKGPDYSELERLRASMVCINGPLRAERSEPNKSRVLAGESVQAGLPRQRSPQASDGRPLCDVSALTVPVKGASNAVSPPLTGKRSLCIPRYGRRTTQYVDLDDDPQSLSEGSSSEASVNDPLPTDSGFFDSKISGTKKADPNVDDSDEETWNTKAAAASHDDEVEQEPDPDTYDRCAYENCRRPQYKNINWVQCDDCDKWYHNLCITSAGKAVEKDKFQCGCVKNGKRKAGQVKNS